VSTFPSASLSGEAGQPAVVDGHEPHGGFPLAVSFDVNAGGRSYRSPRRYMTWTDCLSSSAGSGSACGSSKPLMKKGETGSGNPLDEFVKDGSPGSMTPLLLVSTKAQVRGLAPGAPSGGSYGHGAHLSCPPPV